MFDEFDRERRGFLRAVGALAASLGASVPARGAPARPATPAANTGPSTPPSFASLKQIAAGLLDVGYAEAGPSRGPAVILLHGWPYDIHSYVEVTRSLAGAGYRVIVPYLRGYGTTRFLSKKTFRNGQQAVLALDTLALMDALAIDRAILGGFDWGARTANVIAALWPERCKALVAVSGYSIVDVQENRKPLPPAAEHRWWYQYYFATERGREGYAANRRDFNELIWRLASPKWSFDERTFDRTARAFDNPDHVDIVIHNYRWRLGVAAGEPQYEHLEQRLAQGPNISVPTVTIGSDFDGPAADGAGYAKKYSGPHDHRVLTGIGHDVPQEAPHAFARAVIDADRHLR